MFCKRCRYNLDHLDTDACPECGRVFDADNPKTYRKRPGFPRWVRRMGKAAAVVCILLALAAGVIEWQYQSEARAARVLEEQGHSVQWTDEYEWKGEHRWAANIPWLYHRLQSVNNVLLQGAHSPSPDATRILSGFQKLESVTILDSTRSTLPNEFFSLSQIKHLTIIQLPLTDLDIRIENLTSLEYLNIHDSKLTELPSTIGRLKSLTILYVTATPGFTLSPEIGQAGKLKHLTLEANNMLALPEELGRLQSLMSLIISRNQFRAIPPAVYKLAGLQTLFCADNKISKLSPDIGKLTNLRDLVLSGNQISSLPAEIGQLKRLTDLDLSNNPITDEALIHLHALARLQWLDLSKTNTTAAGRAALRKVLPYCEIKPDHPQPPVQNSDFPAGTINWDQAPAPAP